MKKNNCYRRFIALFAFALLFGFISQAAEEKVNVHDIVFSHIQDSYTWHITKIGQTEISIPLPIIVKGENRGWSCFSSARVSEGQIYDGYYLAPITSSHAGKIVEKNAAGEEVRPIDISMTKNVFGLFFSCIVLLLIILTTANWYKRHPGTAPKGFVGMVECTVMYIYDNVVKECVGKDYKPFGPYLLTVFFFILLNNLIGIIPIFPGGANITGNITITMTLALCTFVAINFFSTKAYWKSIFWPDVPLALKAITIMPFVEFIGVFTKPFALMIRLFANIMAGHTIILALTSLIFITVTLGAALNYTMTFVSVIFCVFMNCLELLVAFLQAYIFTILSASFIGMAHGNE